MDSKLFSELKIFWISRFDYQQSWELTIHKHEDFFQLIYCFDGGCTVNLDKDRNLLVEAPAILFFPPGTEHGFSSVSPKGMKTIDAKFSISENALAANCRSLIPIISTVFGKDLLFTLEKIREEGQLKDMFYQEYSRLLLGIILINLIRQNLPESELRVSEGVPFLDNSLSLVSQRIVALIENNYKRTLTSEDFEKSLNFSYRYLSKVFLHDTNYTPVDYFRFYKIKKAQDLLQYSDYEIKEIALELGFLNVHQFSRSFSSVIGMPPGKWKEKIRATIGEDVKFDITFQNVLLIKEKNK